MFILAATNSINSVDTAFRRPGRFDYEVEIGIPGVDCRRKILEALLDVLGVTSDEIDKIANATHGFVGADLELLVREACLHSITRTSDHAPPRLTNKDLKVALTKVKPSAMRELLLEVPRVSWNDIGGQDAVKQLLRESIQWPLQVILLIVSCIQCCRNLKNSSYLTLSLRRVSYCLAHPAAARLFLPKPWHQSPA